MNIKFLLKQLCPPVLWNAAKKTYLFLFFKSYYSCDSIENFQLVFYPSNRIRFCCMMNNDSFADICNFDEIKGNYSRIFNKGVSKLKKVRKQFRKGNINPDCLKCPGLYKNTWKNIKNNKIFSINLSHYTGCNLKCVYCGGAKLEGIKTTDSNMVFDTIKILKKGGHLLNNCSISVGGQHGEPSLHQGIIMITDYCMKNRIFLDIRSNAARYIDIFAKACENGTARLIISSDAGSADVFKKIKLVDEFDNTWENIQKYMHNTTKNVYVKYLLQPENMNDYNDFIYCCKKYNVRIIMIDLVVGIECHKENVINSVKNIKILCRKNEIEYIKGPFLPEEYFAE